MARRYKCPYCEDRYERAKLVSHIDKKHYDLLPEGYSATQCVFDHINHNIEHHGKCRVCGKDTTWNEKSGRYNTLCTNPKCKQKMREEYQKNMIRVRGTDNILNDAKQQEKMLQNRKISGKYKWSTGEEFVYTGQFERKALEFIDTVLNIPANDLMVPGPSMNYYYEGKDHIYIPDMYLISFNLLIEVKDGGNNPNNKLSTGMIASRAKTLAKEKMVTDKGEFNYIRLTNNNFAQLMEVLMEIKKNNIEGIDKRSVNINESYTDEELEYLNNYVK